MIDAMRRGTKYQMNENNRFELKRTHTHTHATPSAKPIEGLSRLSHKINFFSLCLGAHTHIMDDLYLCVLLMWNGV